MVVVGERRDTCGSSIGVMKEVLGAVYHLQPCDPGITHGGFVRIYNDGFPQPQHS